MHKHTETESPTTKKAKKTLKTMNIILVILAIVVIAFTITMIMIFVKTGSTPDTLITCVFVATTGELGVMGWIKSTKEKYRNIELEELDSNLPKPDPQTDIPDMHEEVNYHE